jgi:hypothetical protein
MSLPTRALFAALLSPLRPAVEALDASLPGLVEAEWLKPNMDTIRVDGWSQWETLRDYRPGNPTAPPFVFVEGVGPSGSWRFRGDRILRMYLTVTHDATHLDYQLAFFGGTDLRLSRVAFPRLLLQDGWTLTAPEECKVLRVRRDDGTAVVVEWPLSLERERNLDWQSGTVTVRRDGDGG